jgi:hypothetical protein
MGNLRDRLTKIEELKLIIIILIILIKIPAKLGDHLMKINGN